MARPIAERIIVKAEMQAASALHVGGLGETLDTDLPLARNGEGRLYIPGTSLAGALRAWWEQAFGAGGDSDWLWGPRNPDDDGRAAAILVDDAMLGDDADTRVEVRDGVGIDRLLGAAADRIKYDRAVLARGTRIELRLTVDVTPGRDAAALESRLAHCLIALERGEIGVGAARTRGLGRLALAPGGTIAVTRKCLGSRTGIIAALRGGEAVAWETFRQAARDEDRPRLRRLGIAVDWQPDGPVMVKASVDGTAVDMLPLTAPDGDWVRPVLPGSALKGVLRSQSERIVRTVLGRGKADRVPVDERLPAFLDQLRGVPLVEWLYGAAGERDEDAVAGALRTGRGALSVGDLHGGPHIPPEQWLKLETAGSVPELLGALGPAGHGEGGFGGADLGAWQVAHHVAIDRWTGGAADKFLYTVLEPFRVDWPPLDLTLDLDRLPPGETLPALALLLLTLDDLALGRMALGFGGNRGLGAVTVSAIRIETADLAALPGLDTDSAAALAAGLATGTRLADLPEAARRPVAEAWRNWIDGISAPAGAAT